MEKANVSFPSQKKNPSLLKHLFPPILLSLSFSSLKLFPFSSLDLQHKFLKKIYTNNLFFIAYRWIFILGVLSYASVFLFLFFFPSIGGGFSDLSACREPQGNVQAAGARNDSQRLRCSLCCPWQPSARYCPSRSSNSLLYLLQPTLHQRNTFLTCCRGVVGATVIAGSIHTQRFSSECLVASWSYLTLSP